MKTHVLAWMCLAIGSANGAWAADGVRLGDLSKIAAQTETVAKAWMAGKATEQDESYRQIMLDLKAIFYDEASVDALTTVLKAPREEPVALFVANRLLQPLLIQLQVIVG